MLKSLSLLQAVDPSGEGSATRVLSLHSTRFLASSMLCLTTSIHLFLCVPLLRCPPTFASKIRLTQSSSSRRCICSYHLSLASRTLSVIHATPRMLKCIPIIISMDLSVDIDVHGISVYVMNTNNMATLVYLSLSGMAPAYLAADCQLVSDEGRRQLRSATSRTCVVRRTYSNYGDRCFTAAGSKLWNSLAADCDKLT